MSCSLKSCKWALRRFAVYINKKAIIDNLAPCSNPVTYQIPDPTLISLTSPYSNWAKILSTPGDRIRNLVTQEIIETSGQT